MQIKMQSKGNTNEIRNVKKIGYTTYFFLSGYFKDSIKYIKRNK